jgi:predicted AlkP superfamily pyrophosphatase or phosphodiesterase
MRAPARVPSLAAAAAAVAIPVGLTAGPAAAHHPAQHSDHAGIQHVLLISVDGMHQSDLNWYVANHPNSELAKLAHGARQYTDDHTSDPSDSDPGGTALMTGGDPKTTGIYYDVEYDHAVFPAGRRTARVPCPAAT